jgi:Family of unknown function (DUF5995)
MIRQGSTQQLAEIAGRPVTTIGEVVERLGEIHDFALRTTTAGERDGIVCFSGLYRTITESVDTTPYEDRGFLERLDLEFARHFFAALRAYARDRATTSRPWRLLFDARSNPEIEQVQFAAVGVNAHINYDLADSLLATFPDFPPTAARRRDYDKIDGVFRDHMDGLRERYNAPFGSSELDETVLDRLSNMVCMILVRARRANAWDDAMRVWSAQDRQAARTHLLDELDIEATFLARALLLPILS